LPVITAVEQPKSTTITRTTGTTAFKASAVPAPEANKTPLEASQSDAASQVPSTPKPPSIDERLGQLQRSARQREVALKAEIDALKASMAPKAPSEPAFDKMAFLKNPDKYGVAKEELEQVLLGQMAQSPEADLIRRLQSQVEALEGKLTNTSKSIEDGQTKAYQQAVKQIETEVNSLVDTSDAFEVIKAEGRQSAVVKLIEQTYKEDGILLDAETAAKQVEEALLERALKLASVGKVRAKLLPVQTPNTARPQGSEQQNQPSQAPQQNQPASGTPASTLTQAMVQASSKRTFSPAERLLRAKLIAQGKNPDAA
jgi:hypothetical protein